MKIIKFLSMLWMLLAACQTGADYLQTIPKFWRNLYPHGGEGLYCGQHFRAYDRRYNIEHVFPMHWVARSLRCGTRQQCRRRSPLFNRIESDMHNMYPARADLNKARGAMAYGLVRGRHPIATGCATELDRARRRVEPRPAVRGNVARAMLYMAGRYPLKLYPRQRALLERWNREDPPDAAERERNRQIKRLQGRANPWIK